MREQNVKQRPLEAIENIKQYEKEIYRAGRRQKLKKQRDIKRRDLEDKSVFKRVRDKM